MDQPKMPTPPAPIIGNGKGPPPDCIYPNVPLTAEQRESLSDPCVSDEVKIKILGDNFIANLPIPIPKSPLGPPDGRFEIYAAQMAIYLATKPKWDAEQARKEEIVKGIAAEQKAEKKKVDSGFYKDRGGRGR